MNSSSESFKLDFLLRVFIEDDGYSASVMIKAPDESGHSFIPMDVTDYLRRNSVGYGFELKNIEEVLKLLKTGPGKEKVVVARGKRPVEGVDGAEDYRFRTKLMVGTQTDQRTDFKERGLINNVRPGQVIAIITKEIPGKPGFKVNGEKVEPRKVRKVKMPKCGINVEEYLEDRTYTYVSMIAGNARKFFNEIQVTRDFIVNGDLDYTKGNIDFVGNVGIYGDVKSGFTIKAGGDIMIDGNVEHNARVITPKNITVKKTVRCGMENGMFEAGGDVTAHTIINSKIYSNGNVFVKDYIGDSEVYCDGVFASSWGTILGSTIEAVGGINVNKVGKKDGVAKNELYSGKSRFSMKKLEKGEEEMLNLKNEMALIAKKVSIEHDEGNGTTGSQAEQDRLKKIGAARGRHVKQIHERMEALEQEMNEYRRRCSIDPDARIIVKGMIYPPVYFCNGNNELSIDDNERNGLSLEFLGDGEVPE